VCVSECVCAIVCVYISIHAPAHTLSMRARVFAHTLSMRVRVFVRARVYFMHTNLTPALTNPKVKPYIPVSC
jgi:hypothetical protein